MAFTFAKLVVAHYILTFWGLHVESTIFDPAASNPSTSSEYSETSKCVRNPEVWTSRGSRKYKQKIERDSISDTYDNIINQPEKNVF